MKILNYGSLNIDLVYSVPHIIKPGETLSSSSMQKFAGGKGANQSVALAKAGAEVWHAGKIGNEDSWLIDKLQSYGVHTSQIQQYRGETGKAIIQVSPEGENSIILQGGGNQKILEEEIDVVLSSFGPNDYLVLQNEINLTPLLIKKGKEKGMKVCLNPAPFDDSIPAWPLDLVDILIVNELEAQGLSGCNMDYVSIMNALSSQFHDMEIVMTVGKKGAYFGKNSFLKHYPAEKTTVVDTTAAGDTFLGYYLASLLSGKSIDQSMNRASKASSLTVSRAGAMDSIPSSEEI